MITNETLSFLKKLRANNNREWFTEHKSEFEIQNASVKDFFKSVCDELSSIDHIENHKVYRIYRDVRFSKDKTPYKTSFNGYFRRATEALRGGYFLNISPGDSYVGGGFYSPNAEDLLRIRKEFEQDADELRTITSSKEFTSTFGELLGDGVKTAPRGFEKDHPNIDLIRKKQFYVMNRFDDKEVLAPDFQSNVIHSFKTIRPFFDYMSEVLTTDLNGVSLI